MLQSGLLIMLDDGKVVRVCVLQMFHRMHKSRYGFVVMRMKLWSLVFMMCTEQGRVQTMEGKLLHVVEFINMRTYVRALHEYVCASQVHYMT